MTEGDGLKLKNGKEIYANCGIIGLGPKPEEEYERWSPTEGYDGGFPNVTYSEYFDGDLNYTHLTKNEMLEVCDIMIERWQDFKKYVNGQIEKDYIK